MSYYGDQTSAAVAEEAEHERADLAHTLDQLRENLQPRNVVDEVMSHAGINSANVSERLARLARANPIATALIGIGAAMLLGIGRRARSNPVANDRRSSPYAQVPSAANPDPRLNPDMRRDIPGSYPTSPQSDLYRRADIATAPALDRPSARSHPARHAMTSFSVIRHPHSSLSRLIEDQPLVLAALGVAVGAAVGSALPSTDLESQLMGDASESVRQNASAAARQQLAQLKATAGQTYEQMKSTVAEHGATSENLSGLVHDLGDDVRNASQAIGRPVSDYRS